MTRTFGPSRLLGATRAVLSSALILAAILPLFSSVARASTPVTVGYRDYDFGATVSSTPTGEKPESKLWFADGIWWGVLWNPTSNVYQIYRFNPSIQDWVSTGVAVDNRNSAKVDCLWDGSKLYVATHIFTLTGTGGVGAGNAGRVYRYSYNAATDTYTPDSGFPVTINDAKSETLILDKDSTGKLWATWIEANKVKVNRSTTNDLTWGTPFDLPVQGNNVDPDDISSIVKFGGTKIGVMWSNQVDKKMYFAVHLDGTADTSWQPRESALGDGVSAWADDHISLKASCTGDGALYAVVKTGLTGGSPLVELLKRTSAGVWSSSVVGTGADNHSRPILNIDSDGNRAYVFMPDISPSIPFIIYMKSASLTDLQFPGGAGTPFINSPSDPSENNPTSTKQCVNAASGLLVLASEQNTHFYLHNFLDLSGTAPTISSFTPTSGLVGTQVTITGARFTGATSVMFNNTQATPFTIVNSTTIRANVPNGATTGPIRVTSPSGVGTSATPFNVIIPPTVTAFAPTSGPAGAVITILGTGFTTANAVSFNNVPSTFTITSDTSLTSPVPAGATTGFIIVTSTTGSDTSGTSFTVIQPPTVTSFSPPTGPGGSQVTVTGTNFGSATAVKFGGISAAFVVDSTTKLRATVPGGFTTGSISVTNPAGTGTSATNFTVSGPVITGFSPATGTIGTQIQIDGSGFLTATAVAFNGAQAAFIIDSNIRLRAIVPSSATTGKITVTSPDGVAQSANNFIPVLPPAITFFTPDKASIGAGVAIHGHDFFGVTLVKFNGTSATSYTVNSDTLITATVPTGATTGPISITASGGVTQSATSFLVLGPPPIQTFSPVHDTQVNSGSPTNNYGLTNELRVRGSGTPFYYSFLKFDVVGAGTSIRKATLRIYCVDASPDAGAIYLVSNNYLSTTTPWVETGLTYNNAPAFPGSPIAATQNANVNTFIEWDVTSAITGDGTYSFGMKNNNTNSCYYSSKEATTPANRPVLVIEANVAPQVGSFTPTSGQVGANITVRGTGFTGATSVKFGGTSSSYTVNNDTTITTPVPAGAPSGPISVTNTVGSSTSSGTFTVIVAPVISSFTPPSGPVGTEVTVHGVGFYTASTFRFNGTPCFFSVDNDTTLRAILPSGATSGPLSIVNVIGSTASAGSFIVIKPPTITSFNPGSGLAGAEITIHGKNYATVSGVTFNSTIATFTVDNDSTMRANVPAGATSGPIAVANPAGSATSVSNFTVLTVPSITSFNPTQGPVGTAVTLVGAHFTGASAVKFNGTVASFSVVNDTSITTAVPMDATSGQITVTNPVGTASSPASFTIIVPPTIAFFSPNTGPIGMQVTIHGANYLTSSSVKFNGTSATFTADNDTTLRATVPSGVSSGPISVTNPAGTTNSAASFQLIVAPTITSFSPGNGGVGSIVQVQGTSFTNATAFKVNGVNALFSVDSDVLANITVPAGATSGLITVVNPAGTANSASSFTVNPAPTLANFTPASGPVGMTVSIRGTGFASASAVKFNGTTATFAISGDTLITSPVPAGATTGQVSVTTPGGTVNSVASFTVIQLPTVTAFNPASGPAGIQITIQGTSFTTASAVKFNGTAASSFTIDSDTTLRATVPAGATSGPINVTNPAGNANSASSFSVITAPAITFFTPTSGPIGVEVTVHGLRFATASAVKFNGTAASSFTIDSDTTLRATVPAGATSGTISVTNPAGTTNSASSFTVITTPVVSSFTPANGPVGTEVTVQGANFASATAVKFNGLAAASFTIDNGTQLRATVPVGATSGPISITNPAGTTASASSFTVIPSPAITFFSPTSGPVGAQVTIHGSGFTFASAVKFNGTTATPFTIDSDTTLRANVPAGATSGTVSVTNPAGTANSAASFTVILPPTVTFFSPTSGPSGLEVTVHGTRFSSATAVKFNGTTATPFTIDSDTTLRANVPAGATSGTVSVTNPAGTANSAASFTVILPPTVTFFSPTSGPSGLEVTVHGARFSSATAVKFNGTTASFSIDSDTTLRANVPAGATTGAISVTNPAGTANSAASFTVIPLPTISSFAPASGPVGTQVTIQGASFTTATSVKFNGTSATFFIDADTTVRANVPAGANTGTISVTNAAGTGTSASSFTVLKPPSVVTFNPTIGPVGVEVTLQGSGFSGATAVRFNGTVALYTVDNDSQVRATVPAGATTGPISVSNAIGTFTTGASFTVQPPPSITSFNPASAPVTTEITIQGIRFTGATSVKFNGTAAAYSIDNDTQLRATVPITATSGAITVTGPTGTGTSPSSFIVINPPTIASFAPTGGPVGTQVTIRGTSFSTVSAARFNGTLATAITVDNDTTLRATVPAGATTGPISVTNPAGTFASGSNFSVIPPPAVTLFNPSTGPVGIQVTITGSSFTTASAVKFNGTNAAFSIDNDTQIRATVPASATTGTISVTNPAGTTTSSSSFVVILSPTVSSFSPTSGPAATEVTLVGTSFTTASAVKFNGTAAASYVIDDGTHIRAVVPAGASSGPISVTNVAGTGASATNFLMVLPPTISAFNPGTGGAGTTVTITGTGFATATLVKFNGTSATFIPDSDTQLRATVPVGATTGPVSVTNPAGTFTSGPSFVFIPPPSISGLNPTSGPAGIQVTITGSNFTGATAVAFNGTAASTFTVDNAGQVRATVPAGATTGPVSVTTAAGTGVSGSSFTVIPAPTLSSFTPASGPVGTTVTIAGTGFTFATAVKFNGVNASSFTIDSDVQVRATVSISASTGPISVTNAGGTATSGTSFTLLLPPSIASFNPAAGPYGSTVTISGSGFTGATAVKFNGTPAATFTVDSDVQIRAHVPTGATSGPISVTNSIGTFTSGPEFTVIPPPAISSFTPTSGPVGTQVTISGSAFTGTTAVKFNGVNASSFTVDNDGQLRATVPVTANSGLITVTAAGGSVLSGSSFTVIRPPTVASFSPASGIIGTQVTVIGANFATANAVKFNGTPAAAFTVDNDTTLRATVPSGATTGPISVSNPVGTFTTGASFTVTAAPVIASFTPATGPAGTQVTIHGSSFTGTSLVQFNGTASESFTVDSDTTLRATLPAGTLSGPISVTNAVGTGVSASSFIVILPPAISSFTPVSGPVGTEITINGVHFVSASAVKFNGTAATTFAVDNDSTLRAVVPAGASSGPIDVINAAGTGSSASSFTVIGAPAIASFSPATGPAGLEITIHGAGFGTASAVKFNGTTAGFTADDDSTLRATVPVGALSGPISVTNLGGTTLSAASFTVTGPPVISSFSPSNGPIGMEVTIHGLRFTGTSGVLFNGLAGTFLTVVNDSTVRATVPDGATTGLIEVTSSIGSDTTETAFTVNGGQVGVDDDVTGQLALRRNYPNPFSARTSIDFELPRAMRVKLTVFDLGGRAVRALVEGDMPAGVQKVTWDARDNSGALVSSGVYLIRLEAEGFKATRRVLRVR